MEMKEAIATTASGENLTKAQAEAVMEIMLSGKATQAQIGAFLAGLRLKGETVEEVTGFANILKEKAMKIHPNVKKFIDFVGTGGDCTYSFNISTTSSFVVAGAGVPVAKHGNRSISSKSGAGDVLEALGVNILSEPKRVQEEVEQIGLGFMFAPNFNQSMKYVGQARKELGIRTVFNILGPLANPSNATYMLIGVYSPDLTETIANVMKNMGVEHAMVVSGYDNMDEITLTDKTRISQVRDGKVRTYEIAPEDYGFKRAAMEELQGGDGAENAKITRGILEGTITGPKRDIVLLNAGAALYMAEEADSIEQGIEMARQSIDQGKALYVLEELIRAH
ncbi:anthranilate phosphoribosyltransferase [Eubacterium oxidoreducens]|uniref:Anthranilate phosphoribosyltransferase n=2 Tax=Eubacterium oxidoreducens TaxID=1732 RepID=A0A1G6AH57_EUBOX|nr:anthranilate phosphoribosyltransferase [Eubacterium oxidoreducens]